MSARHLSFVETGRSRPSPEMVLHLAEQLDVPLRDRNAAAAGRRLRARSTASAPLDAPEMDAGARGARPRAARPRALPGGRRRPLVGHRRRPTAPIALLTRASRPSCSRRRSTPCAWPAPGRHGAAHPQPRRVARAPARAPRRQVALTGDAALAALPTSSAATRRPPAAGAEATARRRHRRAAALPRRRRRAAFFSTIATFGTAVDITLAELAIESFFPADAATAEAMRDAGS